MKLENPVYIIRKYLSKLIRNLLCRGNYNKYYYIPVCIIRDIWFNYKYIDRLVWYNSIKLEIKLEYFYDSKTITHIHAQERIFVLDV